MTTTDRPVRVLTFDQVQEQLQLSRSTIFRLIRSGELPSFKLGKSRRFLAEDIDAHLRRLAAGDD